MQTYEIKHRYTGTVLYSGGGESLRDVVVAAVRGDAYLGGAYLGDADLRGAYLRGADLRGAYLRGAYLRGAYLGGAYLRGAYLGDAYLGDADLRGAYLGDADLRGAYLGGADLGGADLRGAYLGDADLRGADLRSADLRGAKITDTALLIGARPVLIVGPMGSRNDYLTAYLTSAGVMVRAGCFFDSIEAFREAAESEHGENKHGREYRAAIALIEAHASIWTPAEAPVEAEA